MNKITLEDFFEAETVLLNSPFGDLIKVHDTDWIDARKYSFRTMVFQEEDKFYEVTCSRSGNYFSGYEHDIQPPVEVVRKEVTSFVYEKRSSGV